MKKCQKAMALLLTLLLACPLFGCGKPDDTEGSAPSNEAVSDTVIDGKNPTIIVDQVNAAPGDKSVTLSISVINNPGIMGMTLCVYYDETALTMKNAKNGEALSMLTYTTPGKLQSNYTYLWDGEELQEKDIRDGTILTMTFDVSADAAAGTYPVIVTYGEDDIFNGNLESVSFNVINGAVVVG